MASAVKADEPPGGDAVDLVVDKALDVPSQLLSLLAVFYLYFGHLSFSCLFSR